MDVRIVGKGEVEIITSQEFMELLGTEQGGPTQMFYGENVRRHLLPFMPFQDGTMARGTYINSYGTEVVIQGPYAWYHLMGMLMVDPDTGSSYAKRGATKVLTTIPMQYSTAVNPKAGPHYLERCVAEDGPQIAAETQDFVYWRLR